MCKILINKIRHKLLYLIANKEEKSTLKLVFNSKFETVFIDRTVKDTCIIQSALIILYTKFPKK